MKLGLLGGSFNPIRHGLLAAAARAAEAAGLDRVLFIPASTPPLKDGRDLASARDRLALVRRAIRGNPLFEASDLELRRGGVSYTVDTLREIRRRTGARLFWILGADALRLLPQWKEIDEVRRLTSFIALARPGHRMAPKLPKTIIVDMPLLQISSTDLRRRIRRQRSIRYLVPDAVERYILRNGLYR